MACAETGSGKTAAFCFPIISGILRNNPFKTVGSGSRGRTRIACHSALILSPTREIVCRNGCHEGFVGESCNCFI